MSQFSLSPLSHTHTHTHTDTHTDTHWVSTKEIVSKIQKKSLTIQDTNTHTSLSLQIIIDNWRIQRTLSHDIQKYWTAVSTLLCLISSVYHDLPHWRLNQRQQNVELKDYHWATNSYCTQVMPNQQVMVIVRPINLNVSHKLYPYSLQRTRSSPGPSTSKVDKFLKIKCSMKPSS